MQFLEITTGVNWWVTSDTHLGHRRISELAGRPFDTSESTEEMDRTLVANHNSVVNPDDIVIHLGDLAMGSFETSLDFASQLNGTKFLIAGNHDRFFSGWKRKGQQATSRARYEAAGFTLLEEIVEVRVGDVTFLASHFPYSGDSHGEDRYVEKRPVDKGGFLVHGHTHSPFATQDSMPRQFHAGVDAHNLFPVNGTVILDWMASAA